MNEDNAILYVIAGMFAIILASPLLAFWKPRPRWARFLMTVVLLAVIGACWRYYRIETDEDPQLAMIVITLLPALAAGLVAGVVELALWRTRRSEARHARRHSHGRRSLKRL